MNRRRFLAGAGTGMAGMLSAGGVSLAAWAETMQPRPLLFGVDYYPEQTPEKLWEEDAAAMAAAGVTNVRIAEFAWALMEPREGSFAFDWLTRAIGILNAQKIGVILGTPSAAPPPWLSQKYPEILLVNEHGVTLSPGTRRFTCPTNATYRRLSLTAATAMVRAVGSAPGVIGWQIDNELTLGESGRCYCRYCRDGFATWLKTKYQTLDALNHAWGTVFWSNTYSDYSQIPVPLPSGAPPNPGLALDYRRYQSYANVSFLEEQLTMLRELGAGKFITTNNVGLVDTIDMRDLYRKLDFVAEDNYPGFFATQVGDAMTAEAVAASVSFGHDLMRSAKDGKPFLVMEEQTGKAGQPTFSPQPEPGQLRLWSYQAVAHGAMGINYFRWDTATSGAEEYWHGLLKHDRTHSAGFDEVFQTIRELKALGPEALYARYAAEIALCYDLNSSWAVTVQPGQPKLTYLGESSAWYAALATSQAGIDLVTGTGTLSQYKVVCAPLMYVVSGAQAERIRHYVEAGGTFIAGFRLGVKDEASRIVDSPLPGRMRELMGIEVSDYQPIYGEKQGVRFAGALSGTDARCQLWADILDPHNAEVLATYTGGAYAGKAAITRNKFGEGRAIYLGAHLEPGDLARVLAALLAESGIKPSIPVPRGVEVTRRTAGGKTWTYLLNHTSATQTVPVPGRYRMASNGAVVSGALTLTPYGVSVLVDG